MVALRLGNNVAPLAKVLGFVTGGPLNGAVDPPAIETMLTTAGSYSMRKR